MTRDLTLLGARLVIGGAMAAHGTQKAFGWFDGPGPARAAGTMSALGFRPGTSYAPLAAGNEIAAGTMIALGFGGPLGPALMLAQMIVAAAAVHAENGFFAAKGGVELPALFAAGALALAASGYGAIAADVALGLEEEFDGHAMLALSLAGGVLAGLAILRARSPAAEGRATPTFRGKNSPLPEA